MFALLGARLLELPTDAHLPVPLPWAHCTPLFHHPPPCSPAGAALEAQLRINMQLHEQLIDAARSASPSPLSTAPYYSTAPISPVTWSGSSAGAEVGRVPSMQPFSPLGTPSHGKAHFAPQSAYTEAPRLLPAHTPSPATSSRGDPVSGSSPYLSPLLALALAEEARKPQTTRRTPEKENFSEGRIGGQRASARLTAQHVTKQVTKAVLARAEINAPHSRSLALGRPAPSTPGATQPRLATAIGAKR